MATYDAIVIGLGAMGSAAAYQLARRGARVLGLEQHGIAHDRGSSHGQTRICRKAYFEHPDYVPLLHRAYELWGELEQAANVRLFERVGLLLAGLPTGEVIPGVRRAAAEHQLAIEDVPVGELAQRFPGFNAAPPYEALFEADAGYLHVERCVEAQIDAARQAGATLRFHEPVIGFGPDYQSVVTQDAQHSAPRLIATAGAWTGRLLQDLGLPLTVLRKVQLWFATSNAAHRPERGSPAFCFDTADGFFYGFPAVTPGRMKVAEHTGREAVVSPDALTRELHPADAERVQRFVATHLHDVQPEVLAHTVCMYTMTPDSHFIIDRHPQHEHVVFAAGFSGHGFKFAPLVGSVLADLALDGRTREPIGFLSLARLAGSSR